MQNKGAIRLFAILFALVCLYQLSFTWVTSRIEKKAIDYAKGDYKKEYAYLDSVSGQVVYNLGIVKYTFRDCQERQLNLGLDLKGGMNVVLEVSVVDIIKAMSNYSTDSTFNKAIERAKVLQRNSQDDFVTLFGRAFEQINPNAKLAAIFSTIQLKDKVKINSSNREVLLVIQKETDAAITNSFNILRSRIDKFGVVQPNIQQLETKGRILVELPGIKEQERVRKLLQGTANLEFWATYENSEVYNSLVQANKVVKDLQAQGNTSIDTTKSVAKTDTTKAVAKRDTASKSLALLDKIQGDSTKKDSSAMASQVMQDYPLFAKLRPNVSGQNQLGAGSLIGYAAVKDTSDVNTMLNQKQVRALFPRDIRFIWEMKPVKGSTNMFALHAIKANTRDGRAPLDGTAITDARSEFGNNKAEAAVSMTMNVEGAKIWARMTKENIGRCIAIVLDNAVTSSPTVNSEITGGNSQITGHFSINEAEDLAIILKSGKMPAPAVIVNEAIVGPSLGEASIKAGLISFIIAFVVVLIYMMFYYNRAGWVADIALVVNVFFIFGVLASLGAVLTLPGIAGIVLTLGMAVDANVIIYERIREELRQGKALKSAIADGYHHAYSAIIDGNVTTLLTGVVLFIFGTGPIQGFATTLCIGILTSMFTAIFISRLVFETLLSKNKDITFSNRFTEHVLVGVKFDFIGKRKIFYVISSIIIVAGIISMVVRGFNLGIDFSGGRTYVVKFANPANTVEMQKALTGAFDGITPEVKTYGADNQVKISTKFMNTGSEVQKTDVDSIVESRLYQGLKPYIGGASFDQFLDNNVQSSERVGPTIADDIKYAAIRAVFFSLLIIFIYIFVRFKDWRFGMGGVISLAHDTLIVLGVYSLLWGYLPFSLEIDQAFIAAILTVIGYSINDSVIIFDRIREYTALYPKRDKRELYNEAMNSTLGRTLNTSLTTLFTVIVIFVFGGEVIRGFVFALLIGIGIGTYSSIFNAAPVIYDALMISERKGKKK
ncbi:MAG TPA: protein translocase subunit SecDF [Bacteroidales bacterium]|nr:protein translocase subunit SecDF [Bacteroidales bacterium]